MVTMSVLAVLVTVALPSLQGYVRSQRVRTVSFDLFAALTYARSEAIKRNTNVVIAPAGSDWKDGWTITVGGATLRSQDAVSGLTISPSPAAASITFTKDGRTTSGLVTFAVNVDPVNTNISARCISIDVSGLAKSRLGSSGGCT
ncbi:MAG: GspH/FimT family pseudopilin [Betaproteobacteria bacterium]|nr:GspH/FimT family pseudopilin [Betaproteobacteria bacterium]